MPTANPEALHAAVTALRPPSIDTAVGVSRLGWTHAMRAAVRSAARVRPDVTGVDVIRTHAVVRHGVIVEYQVEVGISGEATDAPSPPSCGEPC